MYRCVAMIDGQALLHNLAVLKKMSSSKIMIMVKANAYGHGLKEIALLLKDEDVSFGVAAIDEALILRKANVKNPIFLFDGGASSDQSHVLVKEDITPIITDLRSIDSLEAALSGASDKKKVHIKIDSGFTRLGFDYQEILTGKLDHMLLRLKNSKTLELDGVATHFACTDDFIDVQSFRFQEVIDYLEHFGLSFQYLHMANSAAILTHRSKFKSDKTFFIRPGLSAYGLDPIKENSALKPVMSIKAQVVAIKNIEAGQGVGYSHTFVAKKPMRVAIITMGYGDGLRRSWSNLGYMLVNKKKAPIIGTISMDSCAIDISEIDGINLGDMVTVLGQDGDLSISAEDWAKLSGTISYEILTSISARLTRIIK